MTNISRRHFTMLLGAASLAGCASEPPPAKRVVVVGGGFGGATAAKYIKRYDPSVAVTLVDQARTHVTGPFSNTVIAGLNPISMLERDIAGLAARHSIELVTDLAVDVDPVKRTVSTRGGRLLPYDKLVLSPGIDFQWNAIEGYDEAAAEAMPHAWKGGPQIALLRRQLEAMPNGGLVVISAPANPFRAPTAPYERASLIAHYLKRRKPRSKLLILDAKDSFAQEKLFREGWEKMYDDFIEWVPAAKNGKVTRVNVAAGTVETDFEKFRAAVANIIPPQSAGAIAVRAGLTDQTGFCPVDPDSFASTKAADIHVIGDAALAGDMPKSAFSAALQAKAAAAALVAALQGQKAAPFTGLDVGYSLLAPDYGISAVSAFAGLTLTRNAGGASPVGAHYKLRKREAELALGWYQSACQDAWS